MAESIRISGTSKSERYAELMPQIHALLATETDSVANQANLVAALKETFGFFWVGFYRVQGQELVLGPFQGPVACTRIKKGKGVCGACWEQAKPIVVPDVDQFPGHIACSSLSKSEIVLPVLNPDGKVALVLDVDSDKLNDFDEMDSQALTHLLQSVSSFILSA